MRGHDLDSVRVGESHNGLKTFGNHGNSADESNVDRIKNFALVFFSVEEGREKGGNTHCNDTDEEVLGHQVNLLQHISLDGFSVVDETVDGTNLGEISSSDGNSNTASLGNESGTVTHVLTITKGNLLSLKACWYRNGISHLINRHRLSSESGLASRQVGNRNHTKISRDLVTKAKQTDLARHDVASGDHDLLAAANDAGLAGKHVLERIGGLLGVTFLVDSDPGVERDHGDNEGDLEPGGESRVRVGGCNGLDERHDGDDHEHINEHVVDLMPDALQQRYLDLLRHCVRSVHGKARGRLVDA
mmetsp:Transcript_19658/g.42721  ORF Transcript_19658/g.42721 Transcript_19658/m.42721 type:complete len:303 (-) Transcript_19658:284-1192(-)